MSLQRRRMHLPLPVAGLPLTACLRGRPRRRVAANAAVGLCRGSRCLSASACPSRFRRRSRASGSTRGPSWARSRPAARTRSTAAWRRPRRPISPGPGRRWGRRFDWRSEAARSFQEAVSWICQDSERYRSVISHGDDVHGWGILARDAVARTTNRYEVLIR